jgi:putative heme-binding domain-containing protein
MLLWRGDKAAIEPLEKLAQRADRPQVRLQALCTLDGLNSVTDELLLAALRDKHPSLRRHAVRLAEPRLQKSSSLSEAVLKLADDADPQLKLQVAYSLGQWNDPRSAATLGKLLATSASDQYITAAALSSLNKENVAEVLAAILSSGSSATGDKVLAMAAAMGADAAVGRALATALHSPHGQYADWQFKSLAAASDALARRKIKLASLLDGAGRGDLAKLLAYARATAQKPSAQLSAAAITATAVLARGLDEHDASDIDLLITLIAPQKPPELRTAAVSALARTGSRQLPHLLLAGWSGHSPTLRSQILDVLASREDWSLAVLWAIESGQIAQSHLDARRRQQFTNSRSAAVREKAAKVLAGGVDSNRQKLVETYLPAVTTGGDRERGKIVFARRCANCHKLENVGHAVGPDLAPFTARPADYLLTQILDPNRAVEDRYLEYVVLTADGRQLAGMLIEETGASLTLSAPEGKQTTIARSEIEQIKSSGKSLMPEGIEKDVPPAEMADLLAYIKSSTPPAKLLPGNSPEVVRPFSADGSIRLLATNARVYGPTIKMEETFRALGWWNSEADHIAWTIETPPDGETSYRLTLVYSCADKSAGNTAIIEVAGQRLSGKVEGSGTWDAYRSWNLGTVKLPPGQSELLIRSDGPIKGALFDLKSVRLVPIK